MTSDRSAAAGRLRAGSVLISRISADGELRLSLRSDPTPPLHADEVLIEIRAAPINPSDLGLLLGPANPSTAIANGTGASRVTTARIPEHLLPFVHARVDQDLAVGIEGAGLVVDAGTDLAAQSLLGRTVACWGGETFAQLKIAKANQCLALPEGVSAAEGASAYVNPMTALGMVKTMRQEGHSALIHTAAASNLGQMLNRLCLAEAVPLINVVRSQAQAALLGAAGAKHVLDSTTPDFQRQLVEAVRVTGATMAFDAVGGGQLADAILYAMEEVASAGTPYNRYGSMTRKQIYLYGMLDTAPTVLTRGYGLAWNVGGWLLTYFLETIEEEELSGLKLRITAEIKTTFRTEHHKIISLSDALDPAILAAYAQKVTGKKYLIDPRLDLEA